MKLSAKIRRIFTKSPPPAYDGNLAQIRTRPALEVVGGGGRPTLFLIDDAYMAVFDLEKLEPWSRQI